MASLVGLGVYVLHTQWPGDLRRVMDTFLGLVFESITYRLRGRPEYFLRFFLPLDNDSSLDWLEVPLGLGGSFSQTPRLGTEAAGTGGRGRDALKKIRNVGRQLSWWELLWLGDINLEFFEIFEDFNLKIRGLVGRTRRAK